MTQKKNVPQRLMYFAYGSNMNPLRLLYRLRKKIRRNQWPCIQPASLPDYALVFNTQEENQSLTASLIPAPGKKVEGLVYELPLSAIEVLDQIEGFPIAYVKSKIRVFDREGKPIEAVTYLANPNQVVPEGLPNAVYLGHLLAAPAGALSSGYRNRLKKLMPQEEQAGQEFIAVYGTLRRGQKWHADYLSESRFVGAGETCQAYHLSAESLAYVSVQPATSPIEVEVYQVSSEKLAAIDSLEDHPALYRRHKIEICLDDFARAPENRGAILNCWFYFSPHIQGTAITGGDYLGETKSPKTSLPEVFQVSRQVNTERLLLKIAAMENLLLCLSDPECLSQHYSLKALRTYVRSLVRHQRCDMYHYAPGWWSVLPASERPPNDAQFDFIKMPTLLAMAILNIVRMHWPEIAHEIEGFDFAWKRGLKIINHQDILKGHGYDALRDAMKATMVLTLGGFGVLLKEESTGLKLLRRSLLGVVSSIPELLEQPEQLFHGVISEADRPMLEQTLQEWGWLMKS